MLNVKTIGLAESRKLLEACARRADEIGVPMAFVVVDPSGRVVALHRMDGANWHTMALAEGKAVAATAMRMPSADLGERWKDFPTLSTAAAVAHDGRFLPLRGGLPLIVEGAVVGALGASGGTGAQDADAVGWGIEQAFGTGLPAA